MFINRAGVCRSVGPLGFTVLLLACSAPAPAQTSEMGKSHTVWPMLLHQTWYQARAGESVKIDAPGLKAITAIATVPELKYAVRASVDPDAQSVGLTLPPTTPKGAYTVRVSAVDSTGVPRSVTLHLSVEPMQLGPVPSPGTVPVVLLNGWQLWCGGDTESTLPASTGTFGQLAYQLQAVGLSVAFFNNCAYSGDPSIESLAGELGVFLDSLTYSDGTPIAQFDLVVHSMGGLIARAYLTGLQTNGSFQVPLKPRVQKLVFIATPNFGSFYAANYSLLADFGTQSSEMLPGSAFLWNLGTWNQHGDDLRGADALAIVGNAGPWTGSALSLSELTNASDGVVSLASGAVGFGFTQPLQTRILPYCHTDAIPLNCSAASQNACAVSGAVNQASIANTCEAPETGEIIESFLAGTSDWMSIGGSPATDPYLSQYGGMFFAWVNSAGQYVTDLTQVSWGNVALQTGGASGTVFYDEFVGGMGTFQFTSSSLGPNSCGSFTEPPGYYSAVRCKSSPLISSVTPRQNVSGQGLIVTSGGTITINGAGFGSQCSGCQILASGNALQVSSWTDSAILGYLPALTGAATIVVQASSGSDSINIMAAPAPAIAVAPSSVQFAYAVGGTVPSAQSIQITNSGGGTLSWSASTSAPWLNVSTPSGTAPSTVSLSISPASLGAGSYTGSVQISAAGASNSPVAVAVTLTVAAAPASLAVSPQTLTFNYTVGAAVPVAQSVSITNSGGGTLSWMAAASANWLTVAPASGTAPATLSVSVSSASLTAGTYTATVQITAAGASGSPASVGVTLAVQAPAAAFTVALSTAGQVEPFAAQSIVSAYGTNLATNTGSATSLPLPTSLDDTTVTATDSAGVARLAPLFYVSPSQVNFEIPAGTASGTASVSIQNQNGTTQSATIQTGNVSPGLFELNTAGLVAAWVLPVISGTQQPLQPVYQIASGNVVPLPISLGSSTEQVYLEMYGTGIRNANSVTATVGSLSVPVLFAGAAPGFAGEDQVNIGPLPDALAGKGSVNIVLTADGQAANTVNVTIQ